MAVNAKVTMKRPHVVLLGAGASRAAFPSGDANGLHLPVMSNFIETVHGLSDYLKRNGIAHDGNIENLYSELIEKGAESVHVNRLEDLIYAYFAKLTMPDKPTLYDHLLLCLRGKDIVATFNWDPFLYRAYTRVNRIVDQKHLPQLAFLHGSVATGYCQEPCHSPMLIGPAGERCQCGARLKHVPLLYPIRQKDYSINPTIHASWHDLRLGLEHAYMFTIFGTVRQALMLRLFDFCKRGGESQTRESLRKLRLSTLLAATQLRISGKDSFAGITR